MNRIESARLYVDEDAMNHRVITGLRARNHDVLTALEGGAVGDDDAHQLRFATAQGRVLYTFNVGDFCRLHAAFLASGERHAGIIVSVRQGYSVGEQVKRLSALLNAISSDEFRDRLEFL
ncbi:MAG: hypothetical protein EA381_02900 [Planctomycetaceae bacterium]|nr:MAG: hypothetical protein EA381_02900 [Planctomycetaceae bacterium]